LPKYGPELCIGEIGTGSPILDKEQETKPTKTTYVKDDKLFGELIAYGDPNWYQGWNSTYYNDSHRRFRVAVREFVEKEIMPYAHQWDESKALPKELYRKAYKAGWLPGVVGLWPTEYAGSNLAGGIKPEEFDHFHELILIDEVARCGSGGVLWGLLEGLQIGLPPILKFGSKFLQDKVAKLTLTGEKLICLCITEPYAGSDVASIQTTAKKSDDGKYYILNGEKKWITNGMFADFFTVAVRTGGPGASGISMLLVERGPGVTTRQMQCSGVWSSGTAYITFEDVKVPVENLIGEEGSGFKYIVTNFNHERWGFVVQANRFARVCIEESFKYAHKRKTFSKRLIDHPVIRLKLAHMVRQVEATHAWLENVTYQMNTLEKQQQSILAGPIALMKAQATLTFEYCAREAAQIFGGLAYTRGGQGEKIERLYREVRAYAIPGGSEEIMLNFGIAQAVKQQAARIL
jgi:alkylation response protein AidB-like acyl-CoA dehydrogenase